MKRGIFIFWSVAFAFVLWQHALMIEIAASLLYSALLYVFLPFFVFCLILACVRNWKAILNEIFSAVHDTLEVVR